MIRGSPSFATRLSERLGRVLIFLWSGWAGLAALAVLGAVWQAGHEAYGPFILTSPLDTLQAVAALAQDPAAWQIAATTLQLALSGFALVTLMGVCLGLAAGYLPATLWLVAPLVIVILGVPPIAWIVLAMIWFGGSDATVRTVIIVAALPVVLMGAARGITTRDRGLDRMAEAFGAGPVHRFLTIGLRQTITTLFPALTLALGTVFKVAVMAELLANAGGIGGALADARMNLDIAQALAWVVLAVTQLIAVEYLLVQPVKGEIDRWRRAIQPWGASGERDAISGCRPCVSRTHDTEEHYAVDSSWRDRRAGRPVGLWKVHPGTGVGRAAGTVRGSHRTPLRPARHGVSGPLPAALGNRVR